MNRAIAWFVDNPVAANLLMGLILVGGLVALPSIQQKTMPDMDVDVVEVAVDYLGAGPEEVETGVCIRIEEAIAGIEGIDRISSVAAEGACRVSIELLSGYPRDRALSDIKNQVDSIDTFPRRRRSPSSTSSRSDTTSSRSRSRAPPASAHSRSTASACATASRRAPPPPRSSCATPGRTSSRSRSPRNRSSATA